LTEYQRKLFNNGASQGLYSLITCFRDVLLFEMDYRDEVDIRENLYKAQDRQSLRSVNDLD